MLLSLVLKYSKFYTHKDRAQKFKTICSVYCVQCTLKKKLQTFSVVWNDLNFKHYKIILLYKKYLNLHNIFLSVGKKLSRK